ARQTLPATISTGFGGTAQAFQASQQGLLFLLLLAVVVIYIVLGILYESFIHPLTILSGLPFAGFGALLTLLVFGTDLSVYAFVGVIMLVGLVKKNAIMMIDFALEAERRDGKSPREAILEACSVRFRPIMMTTMSALMGTLPIAIGWGQGGESRRPLGLAVVGGLAAGTRCASMNIPGCSRRWPLGTRALTRIVRPGSCTTGSTKSTSPVKSRPGSAATWNVTSWPMPSSRAKRSGTWNDARCGFTVCREMRRLLLVT